MISLHLGTIEVFTLVKFVRLIVQHNYLKRDAQL